MLFMDRKHLLDSRQDNKAECLVTISKLSSKSSSFLNAAGTQAIFMSAPAQSPSNQQILQVLECANE